MPRQHPGVDLENERTDIHGVPISLSLAMDEMIQENPDLFPSLHGQPEQENHP